MKLILLALCSLSVGLAQAPKEVVGWGRIKWGMSIAEARIALGDQAKPEGEESPYTPYPTRLRLEGVQIGNETGFARIQTKKGSNIVCMVTLVASEADPEQYPGQKGAIFEQLKSMLVQKYGSPKDSDKRSSGEGNIRSTVLWTFPSTAITLVWDETLGSHIGFVTIEYKSVDKKALNAL